MKKYVYTSILSLAIGLTTSCYQSKQINQEKHKIIISPFTEEQSSYAKINIINGNDTTEIQTNHQGIGIIPNNIDKNKIYTALVEPGQDTSIFKNKADLFKPYTTKPFTINQNELTILEKNNLEAKLK